MPVEIWGGPCSIDHNNLAEIDQIGQLVLPDGSPAVVGTRVVGYKSRTELNPTRKGMGVDYEVVDRADEDGEIGEDPQSVLWSRDIIRQTGMDIATEVMLPNIQLAYFARDPQTFRGRVMPWNPSVMGLGPQIRSMARWARRIDAVALGIKNPKDLGATITGIHNTKAPEAHSLGKVWGGLGTYTEGVLPEGKLAFIQRGVNVGSTERGQYRNVPVHTVAMGIRENFPKAKVLFDPSHTYGPQMRDHIHQGTLEAMKIRTRSGRYLYDGALIEVGTSETDTAQHITVPELGDLIHDIHKIRPIRKREGNPHVFYMNTNKQEKVA